MVTPESFRQLFKAFADPAVFSDASINIWVTLSANFLDPNQWNTLLDYGTSLWVAHKLVLAERDALTASAGGIPGQVNGVLAAKAVDKVSASYDTAAVTVDGAGQWNMSRYGIEFQQLARQIGAGGMQIQGGDSNDPLAIIDPNMGWNGFY